MWRRWHPLFTLGALKIKQLQPPSVQADACGLTCQQGAAAKITIGADAYGRAGPLTEEAAVMRKLRAATCEGFTCALKCISPTTNSSNVSSPLLSPLRSPLAA